jgi:hypothetical protein
MGRIRDCLWARCSCLQMHSSSKLISVCVASLSYTILCSLHCIICRDRAFGMDRSDLFKAAALRGVRSLFPVQVKIAC